MDTCHTQVSKLKTATILDTQGHGVPTMRAAPTPSLGTRQAHSHTLECRIVPELDYKQTTHGTYGTLLGSHLAALSVLPLAPSPAGSGHDGHAFDVDGYGGALAVDFPLEQHRD
eukprot:2454320-Rhodomonas_salina.4